MHKRPSIKPLKATALSIMAVITAPTAKADVSSQLPNLVSNSLDGWGLYKFGMSLTEAHIVGGKAASFFPKPQWSKGPDYSYSMGVGDVDQYGLRHITMIGFFDSAQRLSSIALNSRANR